MSVPSRKGRPNRLTLEFDEQVKKWFEENPNWKHPVQILLDMSQDKMLDPELRAKCAKDAAPYLASRKKHVEVDEKSERTVTIKDLRKPAESADPLA